MGEKSEKISEKRDKEMESAWNMLQEKDVICCRVIWLL